MILDALFTVINPITPASPVIGDEDYPVPCAIYQAEATPIRIKDGIIGFDHKVSVALIDTDLDRMNTNSEAIITAVTGIAGQTIENTKINTVDHTFENGVIFDRETGTYQNSFEFDIDADTR